MNTLEIASASPGGLRVVVGGVLSLRLFGEFLSSSVVAFFTYHDVQWYNTPCCFHQDIVCGFTGKCMMYSRLSKMTIPD